MTPAALTALLGHVRKGQAERRGSRGSFGLMAIAPVPLTPAGIRGGDKCFT